MAPGSPARSHGGSAELPGHLPDMLSRIIAGARISLTVGLFGITISFLLGLVLGGAVGNLIDRFFRPGDGFLAGHVIDFIDFQWYPVFNIADIGVVCGGILVVLLLRKTMTGDEEPETQTADH